MENFPPNEILYKKVETTSVENFPIARVRGQLLMRILQVHQYCRYHQVAIKKMPRPIWRPRLLDITTVGQN
jgi:hypothetical protein